MSYNINLMKTFFLRYFPLLLSLIFQCSAPSLKSQSYIDKLSCIEQEDKQDLQTMFNYFNDYLKQRYDLKGTPKEEVYRQFAQETRDLRIAPQDLISENFFEIIAKCKALSLYQDLYKGVDRHNQSEIYTCIWSALPNEELRLGLQGLKDAPPGMNLSPNMVAAGYVGVNDFHDEGSQVLLSLDVFYPILHLYSEYQKMQKNHMGLEKN